MIILNKVEKIITSLLGESGSTWAPEGEVIKAVGEKAFRGALEAREIFSHDGYVTTKNIATKEKFIAKELVNLLRRGHITKYPESVLSDAIKKAQEMLKITLHKNQENAVRMVVNNPFSILTGFAGTGKTTVVNVIVKVLEILEGEDIEISFNAPTGKASRRMTEAVGRIASTIHKKIRISYVKVRGDIFWGDVMFLDESSMADLDLMYTLVKCFTYKGRICFMGDVGQLPSVGIGAILRDMIASGVIPFTNLTHTFRQSGESGLADAIKNLRDGVAELKKSDDFKPVEVSNPKEQEVYSMVLKEYLRLTDKYGRENVAVLVPYRRYGVCSNVLSSIIQKVVNKKDMGYVHTSSVDGRRVFKKGDLVMQLVNRDECANGDTGIVVDCGEYGVKVKYANTYVTYSPDTLSQLTLSYAMSVHKSQGSEYKAVVAILLNQHKMMLNRNIAYTAVTRAKKECTFIYEKSALKTACETKAEDSRKTFLSEMIRDEYERALLTE